MSGPPRTARPGFPAVMVASGIFLSRIFGLVRQRVLAHFLGLGDAADAFTTAFRIPNLLQNLLGEGVLSASFIPVYARLRAEGQDREATEVARAVFGLLALTVSAIVLGGVLAAGPLTRVLAIGFPEAKREFTEQLVRILFPGAGLLVFSAWCLGVLNSHRRFLLSYTAPIAWNLAIILAVLWRGAPDRQAATAAALGSVLGSALQFGVQLPVVLPLLRSWWPTLDTRLPGVHTVLRNFGPALLGRGVVQISVFVDTILASLLGTGAVAALGNAQVLYTLPVSLFGMSVSAAELPEMSSATGDPETVAAALRHRLDRGLGQIAFFVIPTAAVFLAFGGVIAAALFQTGRFSAADSQYVWIVLAGSAVGLLAATMGRLYASTFYALQDTRTPLRCAFIRVLLTTLLGYLAAVTLPAAFHLEPRWGAAGLTASAGVAGWIEYMMLSRSLAQRIGPGGPGIGLVLRLWTAAILGCAAGLAGRQLFHGFGPLGLAVGVLLPAGAVYFLIAAALRVPTALNLVQRLQRRALRGPE